MTNSMSSSSKANLKIVAEIGIAHNGDLNTAKVMIDRCKSVGADAVKFQMFDQEDYENPLVKKCWLSDDQLKELKEYADTKEIEWFCTPEKPRHIEFLKCLGVKHMKVNHKMCDNEEFLALIKNAGLPVYISVPLEKLDEALPIIGKLFFSDPDAPMVNILYCIPKYPPELSDLKLNTFQNNKDVYSGFSSHYPDSFVPIIAMALIECNSLFIGDKVIEVHVKLDNWHQCMDGEVSVDMVGLIEIIRAKENLGEMM